MDVYNVEPAIVNIEFTQGDTIDMTFTVSLNGSSYDLTGKDVVVQFRRSNRALIKELVSTGTSPEITVLTNTMTWLADGFSRLGKMYYDVQVTDGAVVKTVMKGYAVVKREWTE